MAWLMHVFLCVCVLCCPFTRDWSKVDLSLESGIKGTMYTHGFKAVGQHQLVCCQEVTV